MERRAKDGGRFRKRLIKKSYIHSLYGGAAGCKGEGEVADKKGSGSLRRFNKQPCHTTYLVVFEVHRCACVFWCVCVCVRVSLCAFVCMWKGDRNRHGEILSPPC